MSGLLSGLITLIIIRWDVVWARLLVIEGSGHVSGRCRLMFLLGWKYCGVLLLAVVGVMIVALMVGEVMWV